MELFNLSTFQLIGKNKSTCSARSTRFSKRSDEVIGKSVVLFDELDLEEP